jgi:hypothetical protein
MPLLANSLAIVRVGVVAASVLTDRWPTAGEEARPMATRAVTEKKIAANRRNALQSTGPVSREGRLSARGNALKHGLRAKAIIYPDEDPEEFIALQTAMIDKYQPQGPDEVYLVERMVMCIWQVRRSSRLEVETVRAAMGVAEYDLLSWREDPRAPEILKRPPGAELTSAAAFMEIASAQKVPAFDLVLRYRSAADRELYKALNMLLKLQAARKREEALGIKAHT